MKYYLRNRRRKHRQRIRWGRLLLMLGGSAAAIFGLMNLICYGSDFIASRHTSAQLKQIYQSVPTAAPSLFKGAAAPAPAASPSVTLAPAIASMAVLTPTQPPVPRLPSVDYPHNPALQISSRFKQLRKESKYIMGWLTIDKMLDEPVAQRDHVYYLDHDARGNHNVNGAIFLDAGVSLKTRPYTYVLYGHNMKSGAMFGGLRNYENSTFYHHAPFITFDTMYERGRYVIFAIGCISTTAESRNYVDLCALRSDNPAERRAAIDAVIHASLYTCNIDVQAEDQLLVLITCTDKENLRRVVAARRIREWEDESALVKSVKKNRKKYS